MKLITYSLLVLTVLGTNIETSFAQQNLNAPYQIAEKSKGQVVESGPYHLELVPEKSKEGMHLDLFVLKGDNHQTIPNAKVTGQVQLPNGTQKELTFKYDAKEKHYTYLLPEKSPGQYQLKITAEIDSKKVNARYSFKQ
ncbi:MAG: hypothetical protein WCO81_00540 [Cyanobacteriota bacterium ELA615]